MTPLGYREIARYSHKGLYVLFGKQGADLERRAKGHGFIQPVNAEGFVAASLPELPCRVLEVGAGDGELAAALATRGYSVTAIDPQAPDSSIVQKVPLEGFLDPGPFDAVVAITSLHHIHDLQAALDQIRRLLRDGGRLILAEFGWERMNQETARWCASNLTQPGARRASQTPTEFLEGWIAEHKGLHDSVTMREALQRSFSEQVFEWVPYIAENELDRPDLTEEEGTLMRSGAITPIGFRYIGIRN